MNCKPLMLHFSFPILSLLFENMMGISSLSYVLFLFPPIFVLGVSYIHYVALIVGLEIYRRDLLGHALLLSGSMLLAMVCVFSLL